MALVSLKLNVGTSDKEGPSFRQRFHAWWEGYELPPQAGGKKTAAPSGEGRPPRERPRPPEWTTPRQQLVQMLWGDGFSIPGEPEHVLELVKPFGLTKENTMLEIGAGLGGGARTIASKIGAYVDGLDLNADLAKRACELALMKGLENKAQVKAFAVDTLNLRPKYYDACLIRETLLAVEDKETLFDTVHEALKPNGSIVISDFFIDEEVPGAAASAAFEIENRPIFACPVDTVIAMLEERGFEMRINNDETDDYADSVRNAWARVAAKLARKEVSDEMSQALLHETELWKLRYAAFAADELMMRRIVCFKDD